MSEILGRLVKLDAVRRVFVGEKADNPGQKYVAFVNGDGDHTRLILSDEAAEALHAILLDSGGDEPPPTKYEWRVVVAPVNHREGKTP